VLPLLLLAGRSSALIAPQSSLGSFRAADNVDRLDVRKATKLMPVASARCSSTCRPQQVDGGNQHEHKFMSLLSSAFIDGTRKVLLYRPKRTAEDCAWYT
jgi:hypothetical protein